MKLYEFTRSYEMFGEAARRGIFFHPHHNWFVCAAITDDDIRKTIEIAAECLGLVKKKIGG